MISPQKVKKSLDSVPLHLSPLCMSTGAKKAGVFLDLADAWNSFNYHF